MEKLIKEKFPDNADELYSPETQNGLFDSDMTPEELDFFVQPLIETPVTISDILDAVPSISDYDSMSLILNIDLYVLSIMNLRFSDLREEFKKRGWKLIEDDKNKCPFNLVMNAVDKAIEKNRKSAGNKDSNKINLFEL